MLKPIQTHYKGYHFRSRTEARWAVAFDEADIQYQYEPEGFDLGKAGCYLPDFYLPQVDMYAEVKGKTFTLEELNKAQALAIQSKKSVLLLDGPPDFKAYWAVAKSYTKTSDSWAEDYGWEHIYENQCFYVMDYDIFEDHKYWLSEKRFYAAGLMNLKDFPNSQYIDKTNEYGYDLPDDAVLAARSARFEKETPKRNMLSNSIRCYPRPKRNNRRSF